MRNLFSVSKSRARRRLYDAPQAKDMRCHALERPTSRVGLACTDQRKNMLLEQKVFTLRRNWLGYRIDQGRRSAAHWGNALGFWGLGLGVRGYLSRGLRMCMRGNVRSRARSGADSRWSNCSWSSRSSAFWWPCCCRRCKPPAKRRAAQSCINKLKQIALACHNFEDVIRRFPQAISWQGRTAGFRQRARTRPGPSPSCRICEDGNLLQIWDPNVSNVTPDNRMPTWPGSARRSCRSTIALRTASSFEPIFPASGPGGGWACRSLHAVELPGQCRYDHWRPEGAGPNSRARRGRRRQLGRRLERPGELADGCNKGEWRGPIYGVDKRPSPTSTPGGSPAGGRDMQPVRLAEVTDGTTNTLMIGEYATKTRAPPPDFLGVCLQLVQSLGRDDRPKPHADSRLPALRRHAAPSANGNNQCKRGWGSFHASGVMNFALVDGSVRGISPNIDVNTVMPALGSIGGGETIRGEF